MLSDVEAIERDDEVIELNKSVAVAMGWHWEAFQGYESCDHGRWKMPNGHTTIQLPDFCRDIQAFGYLADWCMRQPRFGFFLENDQEHHHVLDALWQAEIGPENSFTRSALGGGDTPGEALCNAILVYCQRKGDTDAE